MFPLLGIKIHWVTEITQVVPRKYFVDEQRFGPYAFWHHKHFLKEVEGGVEMTDLIHYKLPLGVFGRIAQALFVKRQLKDIFAYRRIALDKLFISDIAKSEINQIECRISDFVYYSAETSSIQR
ncbi:MAG: SRPBCC family protein [Saprospiraceae bacterium]